jgi:hypothetical protein
MLNVETDMKPRTYQKIREEARKKKPRNKLMENR